MAGRLKPVFVLAGYALLLLALPAPARAECALSEPEFGVVASVVDGETLKLADGRTVRLIGAKAPLPPLGWRGDDPYPMVEESAVELKRLASAGTRLELRYGGARTDRYDHLLAQVFVTRGEQRIWLQEEMVRGGFARVYSFADNRACMVELLTREGQAKAEHRGLWGVRAYQVLDALDEKRLGRLTQTFQLVEGTVREVGGGKGRIYLNFTDDWKTDFTISIGRKDLRAFTEAGLDPKSLEGQRVRVRGWVIWRNGPMIEATHPEQIEILSPPARRPATPKKKTQQPDSSIAL